MTIFREGFDTPHISGAIVIVAMLLLWLIARGFRPSVLG